MLNRNNTTSPVISQHFGCRECGGLVALVVLPGGDSAYECIAPECGATTHVDCAEILPLLETLEAASVAPALPPLEVLQAVAAELATAAHDAGDRRNTNALNKASYHLSRGVSVELVGADLLIPSATSAGQVYRVSPEHGCSCDAAAHGRPCWHAAIAEIVAVTAERYTLDLVRSHASLAIAA
jgi:hypothetical protein